MGSALARAAFLVHATKLDHAPRALLAYMALAPRDDDPEPCYFGGWDALAVGLGFEDASGNSARVAIKRALRALIAVGAIERTTTPRTGRRQVYRLWITPFGAAREGVHERPPEGVHERPPEGVHHVPQEGVHDVPKRGYTTYPPIPKRPKKTHSDDPGRDTGGQSLGRPTPVDNLDGWGDANSCAIGHLTRHGHCRDCRAAWPEVRIR